MGLLSKRYPTTAISCREYRVYREATETEIPIFSDGFGEANGHPRSDPQKRIPSADVGQIVNKSGKL